MVKANMRSRRLLGTSRHRSRQLCHVGRLSLGISVLTLLLWATRSDIRATENESVVEIILQVNDTTVTSLDDEYYLSVYLTNVLQNVAGIEVTISAGVSGLVRLPDSSRIETTIVCIDTLDCDPADTTIDTLLVTPVDLTGSVIENWEYIQARALSPYTFRIAGVADFPGGGNPPPIPTGGPHLLFRMILEKEVPQEILDTLQDRTVDWRISDGATSFSDPSGNSIGLQDSALCLNPPTCDSLDTVFYYDPAINIYVDGSITFGPNCIPGDANGNGTITASDVIVLVNFVFKGGPEPGCNGLAGDCNCDGTVNASDIVYLVNYIYKSGQAPCT
jgi:hypothetical protein